MIKLKALYVFLSLLYLAGLVNEISAFPSGNVMGNLSANSVNGSASKFNKYTDILSYDIQVKVIPLEKKIEGSTSISFKALKGLSKISLKLFPQFTISSVTLNGKPLKFSRDSFSFMVYLNHRVKKGDMATILVNYSGIPIQAKKAPWDGGFVWASDSLGNPWVGLACEGLGASCWFPGKDEWYDEPEKVAVHLIVPEGLTGVSNGRLTGIKELHNGFVCFDWLVLNPINHYDITLNVGKYAHIRDVYINSKKESLDLDYYVLDFNEGPARVHFQQVKRMLSAFEGYFGPYPFYSDGYKLVETPYWGMEHQSCVAYGNHYENNTFGFDFIIIHESGHEWFANSITAADQADMWIHESFTTYSEALYVEKQYGISRGQQYLNTQKSKIKCQFPMIGPYGIYYDHPDNDIYYKGTWMLHTLRNMIGNDTLWFNLLRDLNRNFYHKIISSRELEEFISKRTRMNLNAFFDQYLRQANLPVFEYFIEKKEDFHVLHYRLSSEVKGLEMPIKVTLSRDGYDYITADGKWRTIGLPYQEVDFFKVDTQHFLIKTKVVEGR